MKYRKNLYYSLLVCALFLGLSVEKAHAQFMPVVYDQTYGDNAEYQHACPAPAGEVVLVGIQNNKTTVTWVKRDGVISFSKTVDNFSAINKVDYIGDGKVLIVGQSGAVAKGKQSTKANGHAIVIDKSNNVTSNITFGGAESDFLCGKMLKDGNLILAGYEVKADGQKAGMISKVSAAGKTIFKYVSTSGGPCVDFTVSGSSNEFVYAAFSAENNAVANVAYIDNNGKSIFATNLPDQSLNIQKAVTDIDGYTYLIGNSPVSGGRVLKLRPEGDVVFDKEIVPASEFSVVEHLYLGADGNILVGGNNKDRCYYSLLRNDGTDLQKYVMKGHISGMGLDQTSGEAIVVGFDTDRGRGTMIGLAKDGRQIYQKSTDGNFDKTQFTPNGIFLASTSTGRICMLSYMGDLLFDRYAIEDAKSSFDNICFTPNGEIILSGFSNRVVKLGHGLYVSDVKINKPVNGYTTAVFTVTLTGYAMTEQGVPVPVTVDYGTKEGTADVKNNFSAVKGSLSFVPANDGASRYMVKQEVEVPIKANNLVEGRKIFEMMLANVNQSYLIKPSGVATIEDQEVLVKLIGTEDGLEGTKDVVYELGLFKTNGEPLANATGTDIIVDGIYGKGTADALDFDKGIAPRVVIGKGAQRGLFNVKTLEDTRYELPKSVVVDFRQIHTISDANVSFEGSLLSCAGTIVDQPALLTINALGDHGRMNNVVSGFFRVSLIRASDGVLLTNATGGDVVATCSVAPETSAVEGKDFVLTNLYDLRIWGDGNRSAINLNGIVLYDKDKLGARKLVVTIDSVKTPDTAPLVNVDAKRAFAGFTINE